MANGLEGLAELIDKLTKMGVAVASKELKGTARNAMKIVHQTAIANIPVGTLPHTTYRGRRVFGGFAKRHIKLTTRLNKYTGNIEAIVGPVKEAFYATQFIELGTSKMAARPWLRPAFEANKDNVIKTIRIEMQKRLERIARKSR